MTVKKSASLKCAKLSAAPRFGNRFSHLTKLGSGTFGEVWKSYDTELERWVAIKRFQDVYSSHLGINMMVEYFIAIFDYALICQSFPIFLILSFRLGDSRDFPPQKAQSSEHCEDT
jgi:serine/threonine protein kinase